MGTFALEGGVALAYSPPKNYTITKLSVCFFLIHSNHSKKKVTILASNETVIIPKKLKPGKL